MGDSKKKMPQYMKFILSGLSGMCGQTIIQPTDLIKNRMQLQGVGGKPKEYKTSFHALTTIIRKEGFFALYNGISAALLRQATYTTTRLGVYTILFERFTVDGKPPNFLIKAPIGMVAGAAGAIVATPTEVALIRMTADGRMRPEHRRNYKNVGHALYRIVIDEGFLALWRGAIPTIGRAIVVNTAQLPTYSQTKEMLIKEGYLGDNIFCHFIASSVAGFVTTVASLPVDIAKTRVQNMRIIDGKPEFKGAIHVITHLIRTEGFFALWKGFTPYLARLAPLTVLILVFNEQFNNWYFKYVLGTEKTGGI